jgi:hypothetical protein
MVPSMRPLWSAIYSLIPCVSVVDSEGIWPFDYCSRMPMPVGDEKKVCRSYYQVPSRPPLLCDSLTFRRRPSLPLLHSARCGILK